MNIIDISWPITPDMTAYKDEKVVQLDAIRTFEKDGARKTKITLDTHTGTHIDAPSHFLADGSPTNRIELEQFIGQSIVLDLSHVEDKITAEHLEEYDLEDCDAILFKTKNSQKSATAPFDASFVYLDETAAEVLVELGINAVGIDYLGIERNQPGHETHIMLLQGGVVVIEGLRLGHVQEGEYFFVCLPLALQGLDGAPARAILVDDL